MKTATTALVLATATVLAPESIEAHGYVSQPKAQYTGGSSYTSYSAEITASVNKGFNGYIFNRSPEQNTQQFTAAWPKTGYKSLRQMMDKAVPGCGYSRTDIAPVDVSRMSSMKFQNNEYKEGFLASHHGPCEGWIDNTRVFHYDDCVAKFPGYPATIRMSFKACKGTCRLTFYWLALHSPKWQAYKSCVPIKYNAYSAEDDDAPKSYNFNTIGAFVAGATVGASVTGIAVETGISVGGAGVTTSVTGALICVAGGAVVTGVLVSGALVTGDEEGGVVVAGALVSGVDVSGAGVAVMSPLDGAIPIGYGVLAGEVDDSEESKPGKPPNQPLAVLGIAAFGAAVGGHGVFAELPEVGVPDEPQTPDHQWLLGGVEVAFGAAVIGQGVIVLPPQLPRLPHALGDAVVTFVVADVDEHGVFAADTVPAPQPLSILGSDLLLNPRFIWYLMVGSSVQIATARWIRRHESVIVRATIKSQLVDATCCVQH